MGHADCEARGGTCARLIVLVDLRAKIVGLIEANGPLSVADYIALCLYDPRQGYYTTREPFGVSGDFTTAPEISQMFGELIAVWLISAWHILGRPQPVTLAEIGPGRGTLMKDMLRALDRLDRGLAGNARIALIETSPRLAAVQKATLARYAQRIEWHASIDSVPQAPLMIVGNELFDALPIRQYVKVGALWHERAVGVDESGKLSFVAAAGTLDPALLPPDAGAAPDGAVAEVAPARTALMEVVAERIAAYGGVGLFIDYGHLAPAIGDTLQAVRRHEYVDPLAEPGKADLTAHVDFFALAQSAKLFGLDARMTTQGAFLRGTGLIERAGQLGAKADTATRRRLQDEVDRLAGSDGMGTLFKVLAVMPRGTVLPPFSGSD